MALDFSRAIVFSRQSHHRWLNGKSFRAFSGLYFYDTILMMSKRFAIAFVLVITAIGAVFISLDILDFGESYRIHLPAAWLDTIFISALGVSIACIAAGRYVTGGYTPMLWLGSGALMLGAGRLGRAW